ncbi:MAG: Mut7-C RNAse domain-containing protein [Candidatus Anstonellales archaeon]
MKNIRFFIDEMLFNLAQYLRVMGYDCFFIKNMNDNDIINKISEENKINRIIFITADKELYNRARKYAKAFLLKPDKNGFSNGLKKLIRTFKLTIKKKTRCPKCNSILIKKTFDELTKVEKKQAKDVIKNIRTFYICKKCKKVYWRATHWHAMIKRINALAR